MPRLTKLPPKAVALIATTGFAAAGVVAVIAENLRTLSDGEEPLPERAKKVGQNSIGAVLAGPSALSERGRSLVGKDGHDGNGDGRRPERGTTTPRPTEAGGADSSAAAAPDGEAVPPRGIDTSSSEAAPDTAKPASREQDEETGAGRAERRADQERAEEAARKAASNAKRSTQKATAGTKRAARQATDATKSSADRGADRASEAASSATDTVKSVADRTADAASRTAGEAAERAKSAADRAKSVADRAEDTAEETAERAARATSSVADRTRDRVEEAAERAEDAGDVQRTGAKRTGAKETGAKETGAKKTSAKKTSAKKSTATKRAEPSKASGNGRDRGPDVPEGIDEGLVADLQRMTVKQLRERAAQDGVAGRSGMSKDELVSALAVRETDETPDKG